MTMMDEISMNKRVRSSVRLGRMLGFLSYDLLKYISISFAAESDLFDFRNGRLILQVKITFGRKCDSTLMNAL